MAGIRRIVQAACIAALFQVWGCMAAPQGVQSSNVPDDTAIEAFTGDVALAFPGEDKDAVPVSDRILDGFQAGPTHLALADGDVIYWGFKFQEANLQSVAIYDAKGHPRLLAAVDNIVRVVGGSAPLGTMEQYQHALKDSGVTPAVSVFVREPGDLVTYLPYLKRWLQADLLGFNVHCDKPGMADACKLANQIAVPIQAYALMPKSGAPHMLQVPKTAAASVPLGSFVQ